jgi:hypothetical protein
MNFQDWKDAQHLDLYPGETIEFIWTGDYIGLDDSETYGELRGQVNLETGEYDALTFVPADGTEPFDPGEAVELDWSKAEPVYV